MYKKYNVSTYYNQIQITKILFAHRIFSRAFAAHKEILIKSRLTDQTIYFFLAVLCTCLQRANIYRSNQNSKLISVEIEETYVSTRKKQSLNVVKSNQIMIVIAIFRLIWHLTELSLVPNRSGRGKYSPNLVRFNTIRRKILHVHIKCTNRVSLIGHHSSRQKTAQHKHVQINITSCL